MRSKRTTIELLFIEQLGEKLKKLRISKGYSQDRLTAETGLSKGIISKIETGKISPKLVTIAIICEALNLPISKIIPKVDLD